MLDHQILKTVAEGMMNDQSVQVGGNALLVSRTGKSRLKTARFSMHGKAYQAIEQNPQKPSRWGKLARDGHRVVQFREIASGKYVAAVVDGKVVEYGRS